MRIIWTASVRRDLAVHFDYIAVDDPDAELRMEVAIRGAIGRLADLPNRGRPGRRERTRELVVANWPYVVVYIVRDGRVNLLRILHTAQEWPPSDR